MTISTHELIERRRAELMRQADALTEVVRNGRPAPMEQTTEGRLAAHSNWLRYCIERCAAVERGFVGMQRLQALADAAIEADAKRMEQDFQKGRG